MFAIAVLRTIVALGTALSLAGAAVADEWAAYGRDAGGMSYSPLTRIAPENVADLKPVWIFHTGDIADGKHGERGSGFETTPLFVEGRLYLATPFNRIIALNAATGPRCADVGAAGAIDLRDVANYRPGWYHTTSPSIVLDGVVVVGSAPIDEEAQGDAVVGFAIR